MGWFRRLRNTLPGARVEETFDEEARFHLEERIAELIDRGVPADEAERLAARRLGHLTLARDQVRDADTLPWLRDLAQDLRYGWRQLRGSPGFAATAIVALAIGVGANTALFGIVDRLLLKTLPVRSRTSSRCSTGSKAGRRCASGWTAAERRMRRADARRARRSRTPRFLRSAAPTRR
jgi:hypothetical protein